MTTNTQQIGFAATRAISPTAVQAGNGGAVFESAMKVRPKTATCSQCQLDPFKFHGDRWLCVVHYRFDTMRNCARQKGKFVPGFDLLTALSSTLEHNGMQCPHCSVVMVWIGESRGQGNVVSLQHDRSGRIRFLCMRCNNRHQNFPDDTFYDHPLDWGFCTGCSRALPPEAFYKNKAGSCCRDCRKTLNKKMWARHGEEWYANSQARKQK